MKVVHMMTIPNFQINACAREKHNRQHFERLHLVTCHRVEEATD